MKKLLLFPYHPDIKTILDFNNTLKDFSVVGVCSYREDSSIVNKINQSLGIFEPFDEMKMLDACDAVLILDNYRNYKYDKYYKIIKLALERNKELLITPNACLALDISEFAGKYKVLEKNPKIDSERFRKLDYLSSRKYVIETPIIVVTGMGKNCGKFRVQLLLKHILEKRGYQCSWISSNSLGALWNSYTFPDFIHSDRISFKDKILKFNDLIYRLSLSEDPDVFIIGIPEGISEFSVDEFNHFGEYPLIVGSAVPIDNAIFCTYFMDTPNIAGIEALCNHCTSKFSIPVQALSIGDTMFEAIEGSNKIEYSFFDKNYLEQHYKESVSASIPVFPIWDKIKVENVLNEILNKLEYNADAI